MKIAIGADHAGFGLKQEIAEMLRQAGHQVIDEGTKSNSATVTYQITDTTANTVVLEKQLESKELGAHSDQLTVEKTIPIAGLQPGKYKVTIKINDAISKQEIAQSAPFVVE